MRIIAIVSIFCLTQFNLNAQKIKTYFVDDSTALEYEFEGQIINKDTIKNGSFKHFYQYSQQIYEEGNFTNNLKEGVFKTYYENGTKHWIRSYNKGLLDGNEEFYNIFGDLEFSGKYKRINQDSTFYQEFYPSGELRKTASLTNNQTNGKEVTFSKTGDSLALKTFKLGTLDGPFFIKNENKILLQKGYYIDGKLNGEVISNYPDGKTKSIGQFSKGVPHGEMKDYYNNGQLKRICNYKYDTLNGKCINYFENGNLAIEAFFFKGHFDLVYLEYFENGQLKDSINYNKSQKNGESKHFDQSGILLSIEQFKNGLYHGHQLSYYQNKQKHRDFNYKDGKKTGENYSYYEDGNLESILVFNDLDQIKTQKMLYSNGEIMSNTKHSYKVVKSPDSKPHTKHTALEKNYNSNGAIVSSGSYVDEKKHGEWKYFNENKKTEKIEHYKNDKLHGVYIEYHPNKKIKTQGSYILGNKSGVWTKFAEDASIVEKSNFKNGLLDGEFYSKSTSSEEVKGNYKKGKKEGIWIYLLNGKEIKKESYLKGELIDNK